MALAMPWECVAACEAGMPCCAMELEQVIALLEAEADRDETLTWHHPAYDTVPCGGDDARAARDQDMDEASDAGSDDGGEEDEDGGDAARANAAAINDAAAERIRANAACVGHSGKPLQAGAWRGCPKSAWCAREDRHRGLCNHKAIIPGPASCAPRDPKEQAEGEEQQDEQDTDAAASEQQVSSGGHSHTCHVGLEALLSGDEREVASTLQQGDDAQQHPQQQQSSGSSALLGRLALPVGAAPCGVVVHAHVGGDAADAIGQDLLWCGAPSVHSQLALPEGCALQEQGSLFELPPAYQPRVKDLVGAGTLLGGLHQEEDEEEEEAAWRGGGGSGEQACQAQDVQTAETSPSNSSSCSHKQPGASSAPSTPSCASAAAAEAIFGTVFAAGQAAAAEGACGGSSAAPHSDAANAAGASSPATAESFRVAASAAPAAAPVAAPAPTAATPGAAPRANSTKAAPTSQAAAAAALAATVPAAAALLREAAGCPPSRGSGQSSSGGAGGGAAAAVSHRPPRVKGKPSASMAKAAAAAAMVESGCSPKSRKRPCSRFATNPSGGHCCTQCGAVSTPVWRAGPAGPKTLCNACGVRYMKVAKRN